MKRAKTSKQYAAELVPLEGTVEKTTIKINQPKFSIGRSTSASYIVRDLKISRNHCTIKCVDGCWSICDQSSQGTFINNIKLTKHVEHPLKPGNIVSFGPDSSFVYVFKLDEDVHNTDWKKRSLSNTPAVESVGHAESALTRKQKQLRLKIEQTQLETSVMETEHSQLEANLQNGLELIDKRHEAERASLLRCSGNHGDQRRLEEERSALERQFRAEKDQLERSMKAQMEELQRKISEKQLAELKLTLENQQLQEELQRERDIFKERLEKEEEQVQQERKKVQQLEQKHQETIASMEMDYSIAGMLQEQEMAEKRKELEEERKTIQSALLEKEKALEVTEEKLKKEGEVRSKFRDVLESELQCSICNELFVCAVTLNCTHTFCQLCITQWKERKKDCPVCRAKVTSETRMLLLDGFIDKAVENLSDEMKARRIEIIAEKQKAMLAYQQKPKASSSAAPRRNTRQSARGRRGRRTGAASGSSDHVVEVLNSVVNNSSIYISSEDDDILSLSDTDSGSSVDGEPGEYYGGYGFCYRCGRRGHWARGCPN